MGSEISAPKRDQQPLIFLTQILSTLQQSPEQQRRASFTQKELTDWDPAWSNYVASHNRGFSAKEALDIMYIQAYYKTSLDEAMEIYTIAKITAANNSYSLYNNCDDNEDQQNAVMNSCDYKDNYVSKCSPFTRSCRPE